MPKAVPPRFEAEIRKRRDAHRRTTGYSRRVPIKQERGLPFPTEVAKLAAPAAKAPLAKQLAAFEQAVEIGPLAWSTRLAKGRDQAEVARGNKLLGAKLLADQISARLQLVKDLAGRLVAHADDRAVADALTRVVRDHPCDDIREAVGDAVVVRGAPRPALDAIATWIETPSAYHHWMWMAGARAVLHGDAATAYDTLSPWLAKEAFAARVIDAITTHDGALDDRFFDALVAWLPDKPGRPDSQYAFTKHAGNPVAQAVLLRAADQLAAGKTEPKWGYFYMMLRTLRLPGTLPALLKIAARAAKYGDWRFTSPLSAIEELGILRRCRSYARFARSRRARAGAPWSR